MFAGGLSPLVATALLAASGGSATPIAVYLIGLAAITVISVWSLAETFKHDIEAPHQR